MVQVEDRNTEPVEPKIYCYCHYCGEPIYYGDDFYEDLIQEACEECKEQFLREYRRVAK